MIFQTVQSKGISSKYNGVTVVAMMSIFHDANSLFLAEITRGSFNRENFYIEEVTVREKFKVQGVTVLTKMLIFHDAISLFCLKLQGVHFIGRRSILRERL